jgi:hypothetical protein
LKLERGERESSLLFKKETYFEYLKYRNEVATQLIKEKPMNNQ